MDLMIIYTIRYYTKLYKIYTIWYNTVYIINRKTTADGILESFIDACYQVLFSELPELSGSFCPDMITKDVNNSGY